MSQCQNNVWKSIWLKHEFRRYRNRKFKVLISGIQNLILHGIVMIPGYCRVGGLSISRKNPIFLNRFNQFFFTQKTEETGEKSEMFLKFGDIEAK